MVIGGIVWIGSEVECIWKRWTIRKLKVGGDAKLFEFNTRRRYSISLGITTETESQRVIINVCVYMCVCVCMYAHVCMYVCMYVYMHMYVCMYEYVCICMYVCTEAVSILH